MAVCTFANRFLGLTAVSLAAWGATSAYAQMPFPQGGVVVTMPQPGGPQPGSQPAQPPVTAQPAAPVKAATPKPKPKPVATASVDGGPGPDVKGGQTIVMLVNDEPITAYEIEMRMRFLAMSEGGGEMSKRAQDSFKAMATSESVNAKFRAVAEGIIKDNQGKKSREEIMAIIQAKQKEYALGLQKQAMEGARAAYLPKFRERAREELIEEKLKMQEARKASAVVEEAEINRIIKGIAERNKLTDAQFAQNIRNGGSDISVMRARFQAGLSWREVIKRKFSAQISVSQRDVDKFLSNTAATGGEDKVELQVQKISLPLPAKIDQAALAQRLADADGLRRKFAGCKSTGALAATLPGAKFEDLKYIKPSSVTEPTRSFLTSAKDGEMVPPQTGAGSLDIYAVCGRRDLKVDEKKREEAEREVQATEFEKLAKRHLRDLRQDAVIEIR